MNRTANEKDEVFPSRLSTQPYGFPTCSNIPLPGFGPWRRSPFGPWIRDPVCRICDPNDEKCKGKAIAHITRTDGSVARWRNVNECFNRCIPYGTPICRYAVNKLRRFQYKGGGKTEKVEQSALGFDPCQAMYFPMAGALPPIDQAAIDLAMGYGLGGAPCFGNGMPVDTLPLPPMLPPVQIPDALDKFSIKFDGVTPVSPLSVPESSAPLEQKHDMNLLPREAWGGSIASSDEVTMPYSPATTDAIKNPSADTKLSESTSGSDEVAHKLVTTSVELPASQF